MALQDKHINYTAADFQRYYDGTMPSDEMHALEKAALEDPFLADALEGYGFTASAEDDVRELSTKIPPAEKERKTGAVVSLHTWLRIAAALILVSGITFITYEVNHRNPDQPLAINETKPSEKIPTTISPQNSLADSLQQVHVAPQQSKGATEPYTTIVNNATDPVAEKQNTPPAAVTNNAGTLKDNDYYKEPVKSDDATDDVADKKELAFDRQSTAAKKALSALPSISNADKYLLKGTVTNQSGEPVSFANITSPQNKLITSADANGNFAFKAKDSLLLANISAAGYSSVNQNLSSNNSQQFIVLPQNTQAMQDVVITSPGRVRQKESTGYTTGKVSNDALQGRVSGMQVKAESVVGTQSYDKYVADSTRLIEMTDGGSKKPGRDSVILSFKVNKNGAPVRIKTEQSNCVPCTTEAIRLLRSGPRWKPSAGVRVTTTIKL